MEVKEFWVETSLGPTKVLALGGNIHDYQHLENTNIIIIIPGNPGLASFYRIFMKSLSDQLDEPSPTIWSFSHAGHGTPHPSYLPTDPVFNYQDQIGHKMELIARLVPPSATITFIGHSVGCKIILEMLKRNNSQHNMSYLLFPTIERQKETPGFRRISSTVLRWKGLMLALSFLISVAFPRSLLKFVIGCYSRDLDKELVDPISQLGNANCVNNILTMADDQMLSIVDLDVDTLRREGKKLRLYYSPTDAYSPLDFRDEMLAQVTEVREDHARICDQGTTHDFVLNHSEVMATVVAEWMKKERVGLSCADGG